MPEESLVVAEKPMVYVPFGATEEIKLSVSIVKNLIAVKTRSGKTCSDNDAMKFLMLCKSRLLDPYSGDAYLIGYDGKDGPSFSLITAHQAFLKRAENNPEYDGMESGVIVSEDGKLKDIQGDFHTEDQKVVGGWATVHFKHRKFPMQKRVRLSRFQKAFGVWADDPGGMICKCAEADALRSSFPTMLGGLYLKEETNHETQVQASAPIFKDEPAREVEVVVEPAKAPPQAATVPVVPVPEPKKAKTPPAPPTPIKAPEEPKMLSILEVLKQRLDTEGIKFQKAVQFLIETGQVAEDTVTLDQLPLESPDALDFLYNNFDDIIERIKDGP